MKDTNKCPACNVVECFACEDGFCVILNDNKFRNKKCPFTKTQEQVAKEKVYCAERLANSTCLKK